GKDDPVTCFVLLRETRDLAAQAGDGGLAINAIEELSSHYLVSNLFEMKLATLTAANQAGLTYPGAPRVVAEGALVLVSEALGVDDLTLARRALAIADAAARRASSVALNLRLQARTKELDELEKEYESVNAAKERLKQRTDDAEANRIVGKYLCCRKGLWDKG